MPFRYVSDGICNAVYDVIYIVVAHVTVDFQII